MPEVAIKTIMCYLRHVLPKPIYVEYLKVVMERISLKAFLDCVLTLVLILL